MKNALSNYYFVFGENYSNPRLFYNKLAIEPENFYKIVTDSSRKSKLDIIDQVLYFQFDTDNNLLYSPNARSFPDEIYTNCKQILIDKIKKDYSKEVKSAIRADAHGSFFVKKISDYGNLVNLLKEVDDIDILADAELDLQVYEFRGNKFPLTVKNLDNKICHYAPPGLEFIYSEGGKHYKIYKTKKHGLFLNVDAVKTWGDKSLYLLNGFRTYYSSMFPINSLDPFYYRVKNMFELGYDVVKISEALYSNISGFSDFDSLTEILLKIYKNLDSSVLSSMRRPFYYSFKIDFSKSQFPFLGKLKAPFRAFKFKEYFNILDFDSKTNYVVMESFVYFPPSVFLNIFGSTTGTYSGADSLFIGKYNSVTEKIDIYTGPGSLKNSLVDGSSVSKIRAFIGQDENKNPYDIDMSSIDAESARFLKVNDFPKAYSFVKDLAEKEGYPFVDIPVVLLKMPKDSLGGYVKIGKPEINLIGNISMRPPFIMINKVAYPNPEDQVGFIIHEYSHHIFDVLNPNSEIKYNRNDMMSVDEKVRNKGIKDYYVNDDEYKAHFNEFVFYLKEGRSPEDILETVINDKKIQKDNLYQAQLAHKILEEAIDFVKKQESQKDDE